MLPAEATVIQVDIAPEEIGRNHDVQIGLVGDVRETLARMNECAKDLVFRDHSRWIEALVALDRQDQAALDELYPKLVELDDDIDTVQQASLAADQAILKVREARRDEGISCKG